MLKARKKKVELNAKKIISNLVPKYNLGSINNKGGII